MAEYIVYLPVYAEIAVKVETQENPDFFLVELVTDNIAIQDLDITCDLTNSDIEVISDARVVFSLEELNGFRIKKACISGYPDTTDVLYEHD